MQADGVIEDYAIGGGIATIYYLEPYTTEDIDIFIPVASVSGGSSGLISREPISKSTKNDYRFKLTLPRLVKTQPRTFHWFDLRFLHS